MDGEEQDVRPHRRLHRRLEHIRATEEIKFPPGETQGIILSEFLDEDVVDPSGPFPRIGIGKRNKDVQDALRCGSHPCFPFPAILSRFVLIQ